MRTLQTEAYTCQMNRAKEKNMLNSNKLKEQTNR